MSELKKKLIFWRVMAAITASGGVLYVVKYDFYFIFIMISAVFVLMIHMTETIKRILNSKA